MNNLIKPTQPIGIFDSGIGGLTVARAITKLLPNEQIIYFGDTAHMPYGEKSAEAIKHYSIKIAEFLKYKNCKMIVIACNTASAAGYKAVVKATGMKGLIINVIDPAVNYVIKNHYRKKVGVIGTKRTISSNVYAKRIAALDPVSDVVQLATPLLAPMIEEGFYNNKISQTIINSYLGKSKLSKIDALILGCTHYPLIKTEIQKFYGKEVEVIDSSEIVALTVKEVLEKHHLLNESKPAKFGFKKTQQFFVSDFTQSFEETSKIFFNEKVKLKQFNIWEE
ncbi:MAG: glutamate racemase [Bacteroidia bacterium]|nr:glutamate racemase [Bacteroidia bacterium]MCF8426792.1 glutamate racemase [Bacteroidia bacterium]MCF8445584.1 glutamate racemase [Bacteroidia bacterium]